MPRRPKLSHEAWRLLTERVFDRDGWKCVRCKRYRPVQAHHILPKSRGGLDEPGNLIALCNECHEYVQPRWKLFLEPYRTWVRIRQVDGKVSGERPTAAEHPVLAELHAPQHATDGLTASGGGVGSTPLPPKA